MSNPIQKKPEASDTEDSDVAFAIMMVVEAFTTVKNAATGWLKKKPSPPSASPRPLRRGGPWLTPFD